MCFPGCLADFIRFCCLLILGFPLDLVLLLWLLFDCLGGLTIFGFSANFGVLVNLAISGISGFACFWVS